MLVDGLGTKVNEEGITFYNNIIDALLEKGMKPLGFLVVAATIHAKLLFLAGITPFITLYHWDLPLHLHESMGGWVNKEIV